MWFKLAMCIHKPIQIWHELRNTATWFRKSQLDHPVFSPMNAGLFSVFFSSWKRSCALCAGVYFCKDITYYDPDFHYSQTVLGWTGVAAAGSWLHLPDSQAPSPDGCKVRVAGNLFWLPLLVYGLQQDMPPPPAHRRLLTCLSLLLHQRWCGWLKHLR